MALKGWVGYSVNAGASVHRRTGNMIMQLRRVESLLAWCSGAAIGPDQRDPIAFLPRLQVMRGARAAARVWGCCCRACTFDNTLAQQVERLCLIRIDR